MTSSLFQVPKLEVYVVHCGSQVRAKSALDEKRSSDPRVEDFLTRCLESPFSRRLDVWSYLGKANFDVLHPNLYYLYQLFHFNFIQMYRDHDWSSTLC